ncbi:unnamed protein product [Lepidochelys olivacea]
MGKEFTATGRKGVEEQIPVLSPVTRKIDSADSPSDHRQPQGWSRAGVRIPLRVRGGLPGCTATHLDICLVLQQATEKALANLTK